MHNFEQLYITICSLHDTFRSAVLHSANRTFTICNWLIGWYIVEYEQHVYRFSENDLESFLFDHLQSFFLELGNGFCLR